MRNPIRSSKSLMAWNGIQAKYYNFTAYCVCFLFDDDTNSHFDPNPFPFIAVIVQNYQIYERREA